MYDSGTLELVNIQVWGTTLTYELNEVVINYRNYIGPELANDVRLIYALPA